MKPLLASDWPRLIRPGSRVFLGGGASVPFALVRSMLETAGNFKDVELVHIHGLGETPWIDPQYEQVLRTNSFYLTPALREAVERGQADYTPCAMSEVPSLFKNGPLPLDVALIQVSPPDADGWCSLGVSVDIVKAATQCARMVIAQINPKMPQTCGDTLISIRKIACFIEHSASLPEASRGIFDERHERIGRHAAQLIEDGSTIQTGLGNSPEAVVRALRKHRHLGIHTGMFNDALMELVRCGAVDHSQKSYLPGKIIASHVLGSRKLYQFVDGDPDVELHPSDWVNDPHRIARNQRMADMEVPAVVVIDPGHGGTDSGAVGSDGTTYEKNLTLSYGLELRTELTGRFVGLAPFHRVLITRSNDVFIDLAPRPAIARDAGADVFASIHFNFGVAAARGTETFVERLASEASPGNPGENHNMDEDEALASPLNTETFDTIAASDQGANNRGVQRAGKLVTRDAFNGNEENYHPLRACLIEVEFISNATALASITGTNGNAIREAFAEGVAEAIVTDIQVQPN